MCPAWFDKQGTHSLKVTWKHGHHQILIISSIKAPLQTSRSHFNMKQPPLLRITSEHATASLMSSVLRHLLHLQSLNLPMDRWTCRSYRYNTLCYYSCKFWLLCRIWLRHLLLLLFIRRISFCLLIIEVFERIYVLKFLKRKIKWRDYLWLVLMKENVLH